MTNTIAIIAAVVVVCIVGVITWGSNQTSIRNNNFKTVCVQNGGTPIYLTSGGWSCTYGKAQ